MNDAKGQRPNTKRKEAVWGIEKSHVKKLINFQHFGNISIVSERSEIKLVKTGLIYALILT